MKVELSLVEVKVQDVQVEDEEVDKSVEVTLEGLDELAILDGDERECG